MTLRVAITGVSGDAGRDLGQDDRTAPDPRVLGFLRFVAETAVKVLLEERAAVRHSGVARSEPARTRRRANEPA